MKVRFSPYLAALWAVTVVLAGVWVVDRAEQQKFFERNRTDTLNELLAVRDKLEGGINSRLSLTRGLVAFVSTYWDIDTVDFESFAKVIAARQTGIDSIYLAKNTAVSHIYPPKGKEAELGRNLVEELREREAIEKSINTKKTLIAGVLKSEKGKLQLASLNPIFLTEFAQAAEAGDYWGIAGIRIDLNTVLKEAGVLSAGSSLQYALRDKNGKGASEKVFFGDEAIFRLEPVILEVSVAGGSWQIGAIPAAGWPTDVPNSLPVRAGGGLLALLVGMVVFNWVAEIQDLREAAERAGLALCETEAQHQELVENANSIILRIDTKGRITFFNEFAQQFFGYSKAEILGKKALGTIVPQTDTSGNNLVAIVWECLKQSNSYMTAETENMRRNGERVWIAWTAKGLQNSKGRFTAFLCVGNDITHRVQAERALQRSKEELEIRVEERTAELKQALQQLQCEIAYRVRAEEELRESEERWQLALRGNNDGIWDWNLKTNEVFYSARYKEMLGYEDAEMANHIDEWKSRVHAEDIPWVMRVCQEHLERKLPYYVVEFRMRCFDGTYKWILARGQAVWDEEGKPVRMAGSHTDITERKQAEEALLQSEAREREKAQQLEEALRKLRSAQAQLIQTEKMSSLGQLVAGVAHEINNPVNFIHGNLTHIGDYTGDLLDLIHLYQEEYPQASPRIEEMIEEIDLEFLEEDLPKILSSMKGGTERIRQIVLSLRTFSRLDEADMKEVDIHEGIESTLLILKNRLKARGDYPGIHLERDYGNLPLVECYASKLNQVFMNILTNAIDAIEERARNLTPAEIAANPGEITISTEVKDGGNVWIVIADNGPGMPQSVKDRIFDPFFTTKEVGKGTGLGMSISYQIVVEQHGGQLNCISEPGKGTAFQIEIPIHLASGFSSSQAERLPAGQQNPLILAQKEIIA